MNVLFVDMWCMQILSRNHYFLVGKEVPIQVTVRARTNAGMGERSAVIFFTREGG